MDISDEIRKLDGASEAFLSRCDRETARRRILWYRESVRPESLEGATLVEKGYHLVLLKLGIAEEEAPIVSNDGTRLVFHSKNFCPTLEACRYLGIDTRKICRLYNENATDALVKELDSRLRFTRNYDMLRPYTDYCEEMICLDTPSRPDGRRSE